MKLRYKKTVIVEKNSWKNLWMPLPKVKNTLQYFDKGKWKPVLVEEYEYINNG